MIAIGVVVAFLPCQMTLDNRPHLSHIDCIGIILEMPKQLVHIIEVHVVMVHLIIALRITTDITIRIHLGAPFLLGTRHIHLRVLRRMRNRRFYIGHLTLGIGIEMAQLTLIPPQHITHIGSTPTGQRHTPAYTAMQPGLSVPIAIGSKGQGTSQCINIRIWCIELDSALQRTVMHHSLHEQLSSLLVADWCYLVDRVNHEISLAPSVPLAP